MDPAPDTRPSGVTRLLGRVVPGVGRVAAQIEPYAEAWRLDTAAALRDDGSLLLGALGDSTAQGIGASSHRSGWVGQLADWLADQTGRAWTVANHSRSGAKLSDVVDEQLPALLAAPRRADLVVVAVGTNDVFWGIRTGRARRAARDLVPALPLPSLVATIPAQGLAIRAKLLNRLVTELADEHGVMVADVNRTIGGFGKLAADGFHPNDRGHHDWARAFTGAVEASGVHRRWIGAPVRSLDDGPPDPTHP